MCMVRNFCSSSGRSAMITHLCAALGRIHRGEPVEPLDEEVYEETSQEPTFPKALEATQALVRDHGGGVFFGQCQTVFLLKKADHILYLPAILLGQHPCLVQDR